MGVGGRALAACATLLPLTGCSDTLPEFTKRFETEHFVYFVEDGAPEPCAGTGDWLETYFTAYSQFLGVDLPPPLKILYYRLGSLESVAAFDCGAVAGACARFPAIYSTSAVHPHEMVHIAAALLGEPPLLFEEGLAEVLGCRPVEDSIGLPGTSAPIESLVETAAFDGYREADISGAYAASKAFVKRLIDRFGADAFLSFYARAPRLGLRITIDQVFREEFGESIDEAFAEWRTQPPGYSDDSCLRVAECSSSIPPLVDGDVTMGCGTTGSSALNHEALRRFDIPEGRMVNIRTRPAHSESQLLSVVNFQRCAGGYVLGNAEETARYTIEDDGNFGIHAEVSSAAFALDVPPGDYLAWFSSLGDATVSVELEDQASPMRAADCNPAEAPLELGQDLVTTLASRWVDRSCEGPWCPGQSWDISTGPTGGVLEAQAVVIGNTDAAFSPLELYVCSEPCPQDASSCEVLTLETGLGKLIRSEQVFEPGTVLHLGAPEAPDGEHFTLRLRIASE
ncbi:MAG: hypothetical protein WKG00_27525 [Polyangiaceae bacterium]